MYSSKQDEELAAKIKSILTKFANTKLSVAVPAAGESDDTSELLDYLLEFCCKKSYRNMKLQNTVPKLCYQVSNKGQFHERHLNLKVSDPVIFIV